MIGNGSIAQSHLTNGKKGDYFTINWGWALGCSLGILVSANISGNTNCFLLKNPFVISLLDPPGGHLNPAVTLALTLVRDFPWRRLPAYWFAQYLGALAASGTVLGVYYGFNTIPIHIALYLSQLNFS